MKPKTMILMVVAVVCGLGASYMTSKLLAERDKGEAEPTVAVLVVKPKLKVSAWQPVKDPEAVFEIRQFPVSVAPPKAIDNFEAIKDQMLNKPLDEGKVLTQNDLLTKEQRSMAENLKPGQRAIAIKVTQESLVGGFVLPSTRVDVMCTTRGTDASARIILQNMLVLAVDTQDKRDEKLTTMMGQTVTLAATSEEAARLSLAQSLGELRLLLKNTNDLKRTTTTEARADDLRKPLHNDSGNDEEARPAPKAIASLPVLTEEAKQPEPVVPEPVKKAPAKRKRHVMTIVNGSNTDKAVFLLGKSSDDDDEDAPTKDEEKPRTEKTNTAPPKVGTPLPPKAVAPTTPTTPTTPPTTTTTTTPSTPTPGPFGRSARTGRIN
jgi:pilus assembly protein CpaB